MYTLEICAKFIAKWKTVFPTIALFGNLPEGAFPRAVISAERTAVQTGNYRTFLSDYRVEIAIQALTLGEVNAIVQSTAWLFDKLPISPSPGATARILHILPASGGMVPNAEDYLGKPVLLHRQSWFLKVQEQV